VARTGWAAAGLLAGYLLLWVFNELPAEWLRLAASRRVIELARPLFDSIEATRSAVRVMNVALLALPGGILLGGLVGAAMARIRHPRVLAYSTLLWPAYVLARSEYRYVTAESHALQFHQWEIRNYTFFDTAVIGAVFFVAVYAAYRLSVALRARRAG
jgi:hypothetical protein